MMLQADSPSLARWTAACCKPAPDLVPERYELPHTPCISDSG